MRKKLVLNLHMLVCVIGPKFVRKKIKAMNEINNEQVGWLEITYLSNKLRICRGDKGTLFVLRKINSPTLFKNFKDFIKIYKNIN